MEEAGYRLIELDDRLNEIDAMFWPVHTGCCHSCEGADLLEAERRYILNVYPELRELTSRGIEENDYA